ncbi:lytic murein transglycosylase [Methyloligella sp. 2.7D]|uniref:lytic murein transglycosylase n=1 Tax=unclassified Methyloligella TaxID=2625955 RepID=UPI00157D1527|nr:lytic murein transglycosylase [Methyloligella sp. GL2]QKP77059.1 lytic murein transglycosylase [Methyloligella sp. GL2]
MRAFTITDFRSPGPSTAGAKLARAIAVLSVIAFGLAAGPVSAATCRTPNPAGFPAWLQSFKQKAVAEGVSPQTVNSALAGVRYDRSVINKDRAQHVFAQDFLQFSGRMVASYRLQHGAANIKKYGNTFSRIQQQFGVPAPVITAFWGLETDFGANTGNGPTLQSLATLAFDCRRSEEFNEQLMAALRIIDRGDLTPGQMRGPWAGELGQTQFLPTVYYEYGVDYDGDGHVNLIRSTPDALASTANYLKHLGWRAGEPWLEEVRVPASMPWELADLTIKKPRALWSRFGVTRADGSPLPEDNLPAALILPMGRNGPAFLAYPNFDVYIEWNQSLVYSLTAAYFATRLAGAPPLSKGRAPVEPFSMEETKQLQTLLLQRGYDVGKVDGVIGEKTREAVRDVQVKLGLPADSYPDHRLLAALQRG